MTQKTLPILGTVCAISIVLVGFMAGCKKKDTQDKETTSQSTTEETSSSSSEKSDKKDISFQDKDDVKSETGSSEHSAKEEKANGDKAKKEDEESSKKEDDSNKGSEEPLKTGKANAKDGKRVALVEKALENMASSLSEHANAKVDALEDVILA